MDNQDTILSRDEMLSQLHEHCVQFQKESASWRKNSFESQWARWQRNADSIFDPEISKKKEPWQSRAFWPITPSHRENAQAQLVKTELGPNPPLEMKARDGIIPVEMDQSEIIRDLILREREKSRYPVGRNDVVEDKTTYGSGFCRMYFDTVIEDRPVKVPVFEEPTVFNPASIMRHMSGQPMQVGVREEMQPTVIYRGVRFQHISIWDIFPDPKALQIKGHAIAYRCRLTYGDIVKGVQEGYYLPECLEKLKDVSSAEETPEDQRQVQVDRGIADSNVKRTDYQKNLECFEFFAKLPKKWVLINGQAIDDPEKLVPARIIFHELTPICVELSDEYDGEPPIYKDDYMPVAGQFYGRGIPEMLKDVQLVTNEEINQRLDSKAITLNPMFAALEKNVVDPRDFISKTGGVIRLKAKDGVTDIRQAFMRIDMGTIDRAAFIEPQEWERAAQERTSVTRGTMGTAGQVKDANQTLGGMEMLRQAAGEKFLYLGMLSEFRFQYEVNRAYYKLIYKNYNQEDLMMALGPERASQFIPMTPEQVENSYQYIPTGIFTMENRSLRQARIGQWVQRYGMMPWANVLGAAKAELNTANEDPKLFILPEADAMQIIARSEQMASNMAAKSAQSAPPEGQMQANTEPPK